MSKSKASKNSKDAKIMVADLTGQIKKLKIQLDGQEREKEIRAKMESFKQKHSKLSEGRDKPDYFYEQEFWDLNLKLESLGQEAMMYNLQASIDTAKQQIKFAEERLEVYKEKVIE